MSDEAVSDRGILSTISLEPTQNRSPSYIIQQTHCSRLQVLWMRAPFQKVQNIFESEAPHFFRDITINRSVVSPKAGRAARHDSRFFTAQFSLAAPLAAKLLRGFFLRQRRRSFGVRDQWVAQLEYPNREQEGVHYRNCLSP